MSGTSGAAAGPRVPPRRGRCRRALRLTLLALVVTTGLLLPTPVALASWTGRTDVPPRRAVPASASPSPGTPVVRDVDPYLRTLRIGAAVGVGLLVLGLTGLVLTRDRSAGARHRDRSGGPRPT
jgi:hypothetical protein